jgi:hypothetical protein
MNKLKIGIGILILFCYLCPFASCGVQNENTETAITDSATSRNIKEVDQATEVIKEKNYSKRIIEKISFPTENSISGIGQILNMQYNIVGLFILISFLLSIIQLIPIKILKQGTKPVLIQSANLGMVLIAIIYSIFIRNDELLWGIWLLTTLVITRLIIEIRYKT